MPLPGVSAADEFRRYNWYGKGASRFFHSGRKIGLERTTRPSGTGMAPAVGLEPTPERPVQCDVLPCVEGGA